MREPIRRLGECTYKGLRRGAGRQGRGQGQGRDEWIPQKDNDKRHGPVARDRKAVKERGKDRFWE
jgi:hypothetical protein